MENKFVTILRRNAGYIILAFCILAIGLSATFVLINKSKKQSLNNENEVQTVFEEQKIEEIKEEIKQTDTTENNTTPVVKVKTYMLPVENITKIDEYSESLVFNETLNRFASHKAVDFFAEEGSLVYAIDDGKIESIDNTLIYGTTITIDHGDGIKSIYNSLADGEKVKVGQTVKKGDVIGEVSITNRQESKEGSHLHFEMRKNNSVVDPAMYLNYNNK